MTVLGFVGNGADKFTPQQAKSVKQWMRALVKGHGGVVAITSGHSPLGGVDLWAEEVAAEMRIKTIIHPATVNRWDGGYKERNLRIAETADVLYVIVSSAYPETYKGRRFKVCYHHRSDPMDAQNEAWHVKSGGCWTGQKAKDLGKRVRWIIV